MTTEKRPIKPSPRKQTTAPRPPAPFREGRPATQPSKRPQIDPPRPWSRKS